RCATAQGHLRLACGTSNNAAAGVTSTRRNEIAALDGGLPTPRWLVAGSRGKTRPTLTLAAGGYRKVDEVSLGGRGLPASQAARRRGDGSQRWQRVRGLFPSAEGGVAYEFDHGRLAAHQKSSQTGRASHWRLLEAR